MTTQQIISLFHGVAGVAVLSVLFVFLRVFIRLRKVGKRADSLDRQNRQLRDSFGELSGWTDAGRLPENLVDEIRSSVLASAELNTPKTLPDSVPFGLTASLLAEYGAPNARLIGGEKTVMDRHDRLVRTFRRWSSEPDDTFDLLVNGELDYLFRMGLRMEAYNPTDPARLSYDLAAVAIRLALKKMGVEVLVVQPLMLIVGPCERVSQDPDELRTFGPIRDKWTAVANQLEISLDGLVLDCVAPGWRVDGEVRESPRALLIDRFLAHGE